MPNPGQHLVIDWTTIGFGLHMFCAVLAWSRYRFIRFASSETRETTLGLLAECFEELGAVPAVVLSDRKPRDSAAARGPGSATERLRAGRGPMSTSAPALTGPYRSRGFPDSPARSRRDTVATN